jgi:hypothetical protein
MDYVYFGLIIVALGGASYLLTWMDKKTKNKHKIEAYHLLDSPDASNEDIKKNIKMLRLYGGRWRKDKEFIQLINRLIDKLEKSGAVKKIV